ncbi:MAG TPA: hypothetical protein VN947_08460 [Polyangia bacterium]|nr:hypothetical protein [Polyangia bacterium]
MKWAALTLVIFVAAACSNATNTQYLPIGSRCSQDSQCGTMPYDCNIAGHPFGYCEKTCALDSECPTDSLCAPAPVGKCRRICTDDAGCRVSEGYSCQPLEGKGICDVAPTVDGGQP